MVSRAKKVPIGRIPKNRARREGSGKARALSPREAGCRLFRCWCGFGSVSGFRLSQKKIKAPAAHPLPSGPGTAMKFGWRRQGNLPHAPPEHAYRNTRGKHAPGAAKLPDQFRPYRAFLSGGASHQPLRGGASPGTRGSDGAEELNLPRHFQPPMNTDERRSMPPQHQIQTILFLRLSSAPGTGEPDAGNPHVRFGEGRGRLLRKEATATLPFSGG